MTDDEDINIEIHQSWINNKRYVIRATYKGNNIISGFGCAEQSIFRVVGIGDTLQQSLKKETCKAVQELKENYTEYIKRLEFEKFLEQKAREHIKKCDDNDGT